MKKLLLLLLLPLTLFGQKETIIHITTDNYPQETRWVLYADSMYGSILGSVQYGYYTQPNTPHMDTLYIPDSLANIIGFENIKRVEDEIGPPDKLGGWSDEEKAQLQYALNKLKSTRKKYPIKDYSHKKDEYKVK